MAVLHLDLKGTDLEDFIEHFEHDFKTHILKPKTGQWILRDDDPLPDINAERYANLTQPFAKASIDIDWTNSIRVRLTRSGATRFSYMMTGHSERMGSSLLFMLNGFRFRRKRLKLVMYDYQEDAPYIERMNEWLELCWEGAIVPGDPEKTPPPDDDETKKRWQPRSPGDRWFLEQYFDVHKEQRPAYLFVDEWLDRRKEEDQNFDPPNPSNNLQQLMTREKKEREREEKNLH